MLIFVALMPNVYLTSFFKDIKIFKRNSSFGYLKKILNKYNGYESIVCL